MSIEVAERLKQELTDKYVVVAEGVPELRRFAGLTGMVKTVNMNGYALVQFDSPVDISWYDIHPDYLTVVEAPLKKKTAETPAASPAKATSAPKPATQPASGAKAGGKKSPLELAREQAAAGKKTPAKPTPASAKGKGGPSPLEMARQQGAAKAGAKAEQSAEAEIRPPAPSENTENETTGEPKPAGKKLSPLELARRQGAFREKTERGKTEAADASQAQSVGTETAVEVEEEPAPQEQEEVESPPQAESAPAEKPSTSTTGPDGKKLSPLELARRQGPFKG